MKKFNKLKDSIFFKMFLLALGVVIPLSIEKFVYNEESFNILRALGIFLIVELVLIGVIYFMRQLHDIYYKVLDCWNKFINYGVFKYIFKVLPHNIFVFVFFVIGITITINFMIDNTPKIIYEQSSTNVIVGEIVNKEQVYSLAKVEPFINESFNNICIRIGAYARVNNADYELVIMHGNTAISSTRFNASKASNNDYNCFDITSISTDSIKEYSIKIKPLTENNTKSNSITVFTNDDGILSMKLMQKNGFWCIESISFIVLMIIFCLINFLLNTKKISEHKFYMLLLIYIVAIGFIYPPYQIPDEPYHFFRAYSLSNYKLNKSAYENSINYTYDAPVNIDCLNYSHIQAIDRVSSFDDIKECALSLGNTEYHNNYSQSNGNISGYFTSALGIKIADIFTNSPVVIFYAGRMFNIILTFILIYFAIKITPVGKKTILAVATIPMFLQQMCSYSYDSVLNAVCLLFVSYLLSYVVNKTKFTWFTALKFALMLFVIFNIKAVYVTIGFMLIFIPKECFKDGNRISTKKKIINILLVLCLFIAIYLIHNLIVNFGAVATTSEVNKQIEYIKNNPLQLIPIAIRTLKSKTWFYLAGLVGYFGWFRFKLDDIYIYVYMIYFVLLCLSERSPLKGKINKAISIIGILIVIAGIFGAMYFGWSAYKLGYVEGVQGRYFIPLLLPIIAMLWPKKEKINIDNNTIYTFTNAMIMQYILVLISFYY